jgi:hypothetical protein
MTTTPNAPMPEPLSPAAQAVLDAAVVVSWDWSNLQPASSSVVAAAALRAAAAHLGSCNASEELIRIANELEGRA